MRRVVAIAVVLVAAAALLVVGVASGQGGGDYRVRAIFDNGSFIVTGEEVRIAGARVGTVDEVAVSQQDEIVSLEDGGEAIPGKAVVVLEIDDEGFQDFREDASCLIRPQSLLGEKFVECRPTEPHAAGTESPPPLEEIPDGEPGEGERLLPLENNGATVDLDVVNNIMELPERERFRIILNDLGAGLAARGEELQEIVERANPALRQTDRVLEILAAQNRGLARLARDSDRVLGPLARDRRAVSGFINEANATAEASAERRSDIEAGLERFPGALREVRLTMRELSDFAEEATPALADLRRAAPATAAATRELGPFAAAATPALISLGKAAERSGPDLVASEPVLGQLRRVSNKAKPGARSLARLLGSLRRTTGFDQLMDLIFNASSAVNGFDDFGHFLRTSILVTNCTDYVVRPQSGCEASFDTILPRADLPLFPGSISRPGALGASSSTAPDGGEEADRAPAEADARALLDFLTGDGS